MNTNLHCIIDSAYGIYIPQTFAITYSYQKWNCTADDWEILLDIDHEYYLETWEGVLNNAYFIDANNTKWVLYQDTDLFITPVHD